MARVVHPTVVAEVYGVRLPRRVFEGHKPSGVTAVASGVCVPHVILPREDAGLVVLPRERKPRCVFASSAAFWRGQPQEQPRTRARSLSPVPLAKFRATKSPPPADEWSMSEYGEGVRALLQGRPSGWCDFHLQGALLVLAHTPNAMLEPVLDALEATTDPLVYFPTVTFRRARTAADLGARGTSAGTGAPRLWLELPDVLACVSVHVFLEKTDSALCKGRYFTSDLRVLRVAMREHLRALVKVGVARFQDREYVETHVDLARAVYLLPMPVHYHPVSKVTAARLPACVGRALTNRNGKDHLDNSQRLFLGYLLARTNDDRFRGPPSATAVTKRFDMKFITCHYTRDTLALCPYADAAAACSHVHGPIELISPS